MLDTPQTKARMIPSRAKNVLVKSEIVRQIQAGELRPGFRFPGTAELAARYGVSYVTLHRALRELETENFVERRNGVGTFVRGGAPAPAITKIGVPLRVEGNPFFVSCYEEMSRVANELGIQTAFGSGERELDFIERLAADGVKAMIRFPGGPSGESAVHECLRRHGMRAVMINDWWLEGGPFPCVRTDEEAAATELLEHLHALGHRNVALCQDSFEESRPGVERVFHRWHWRHGLRIEPSQLIYLAGSREEFVKTIGRGKFSALLFTFDVNALIHLRQLRANGLRVPEDVSVASMDGIHDALAVGVTVMKQDIPALVKEAFRTLLPADYDKAGVSKIAAQLIKGKTTCEASLPKESGQ